MDFPAGTAPVLQVSCGAFHTGAVTRDGRLYTWGKEDHGMLGLQGRDLHRPAPVELSDRATYDAGVRWWSCGVAHRSQRLTVVCCVRRYIACGGWHTLLIADGKVIAFGRGEYGRLGVGDDRSRLKPTPVRAAVAQLYWARVWPMGVTVASTDREGMTRWQMAGITDPKRVMCGGTHSLVLTRSGHVATCGRGTLLAGLQAVL